jgi:hypothetical protein
LSSVFLGQRQIQQAWRGMERIAGDDKIPPEALDVLTAYFARQRSLAAALARTSRVESRGDIALYLAALAADPDSTVRGIIRMDAFVEFLTREAPPEAAGAAEKKTNEDADRLAARLLADAKEAGVRLCDPEASMAELAAWNRELEALAAKAPHERDEATLRARRLHAEETERRCGRVLVAARRLTRGEALTADEADVYRRDLPNLFGADIVAGHIKVSAGCLEILDRLAATKAALLVAIAARRYELEHGRLPETVGELVRSGVLAEHPIDPFSGRPLGYDARRRRVWSVGADGRDHGGTAEPWTASVKAADLVASVPGATQEWD